MNLLSERMKMMVKAQDFWNIPDSFIALLYVIASIAIMIFFIGFWYKARIWSTGRDTNNSLKGVGTLGLMWISITKLFLLTACWQDAFSHGAKQGLSCLWVSCGGLSCSFLEP